MSKTRSIVTYFDFGCPFCYNEWMFMKKIREQVALEEDYYSWEIHPSAPQEGVKADWPGRAEMCERLNRLGEPVGVRPGDMEYVYNTRKALQIFEEARKQGKMLSYMDAVFHAYFEEKQNVAEDAVILEIADRVGIEGARDVLLEGRYLDVIAAHDAHCMEIELAYVPTIFEDGKILLSGELTWEMMQETFLVDKA